jgi:hypothetical protein
MTVLGASALLVAGLMGSPAAAFAAPVAGASVAITGGGNHGATCPKDGKVDVVGDHKTVEVTAEPGYLITGYCVKAGPGGKAGSSNEDLGPVDVVVDPPSATVTISHPSGKDVSHYTLVTVKVGSTPTPTEPGEEPTEPGEEPTVPGEEPTEPGEEPTQPGEEPTVPGEEPTEPGEEPTQPGEEPTVPGVEPTVPGEEPTDGSVAPVDGDVTPSPSPSAATDGPGVLAATGASTAIGFTLIALALVGGGVTLIVLRRKGVLGS